MASAGGTVGGRGRGMAGRAGQGDPLGERTASAVGRLPRYALLAGLLVTDPRVPRSAKAALTAGGIYLVSPVDLVPGLIPVAGQLDDLAVMLVALRFAIRSSPPGVVRPLLERSGVTLAELDADLATLRDGLLWAAGQGLRGAWRLTRAAARRLPPLRRR